MTGLTQRLRKDQPIYQQIMRWVIQKAIRGEWKQGDQLPSIRNLAQELHVNPNTVARAFLELEREGWLETRRGEGTFLKADPHKIQTAQAQILQELVKEVAHTLLQMGKESVIDLFCETLRHHIDVQSQNRGGTQHGRRGPR